MSCWVKNQICNVHGKFHALAAQKPNIFKNKIRIKISTP